MCNSSMQQAHLWGMDLLLLIPGRILSVHIGGFNYVVWNQEPWGHLVGPERFPTASLRPAHPIQSFQAQ